MNNFLKRITNLLFGLFLFALGVVITMKANLGFAPWDVFHQGIAKTVGMSIGNVSILMGLVICILVFLMGEKIGLGTLLNMLLVGFFIDRILELNILPEMGDFISGVAMMIAGLFTIAFASYFYIGSGFGAGPRDSLMVAVERKTGLAVGVSRGIVEGTAVLIGCLLGGPVGFGTVLAAFGVGFCVQIVFSVLKFDVTRVKHETLRATLESLKSQ
ncbi:MULTISPECIES: YczE/YyaS/YitT family protein [Aminobacterium]|jgi:hypothetical protein|uniref:YczE/YyaS/YitT family protein n=1 Tax=Aminobacterium TaxID=81466 RepID=UPI00257B74E8|nr:hypothetical protein [Aminobacterium sp. UBA4987]